MKKIYNSPKSNFLTVSVKDVISASDFLTHGVDNEANGKFGEINALEL